EPVPEPQPAPEVFNDDGGPVDANDDQANLGDDEMDHGVNDSDSEDPDFEQPTNQTPNSSYRGSSQSDHEVDDKIDGQEVSSYARQPYYDPNRDHSKLVWKEGLKFTSTHQFRDAIVNFTIAVGADIKWKRANKVCREVMCMFLGCKWRVYAS
ncbi:hypothetical protein LINGRAPRIM_LOCUS206, partial [Linum grandiflorum]